MKKYLLILSMFYCSILNAQNLTYPIIDTGQEKCYDENKSINFPNPGEAFYGQDAQHKGLEFNFRDNGDGTTSDLNTGLMWQNFLPDDKYTLEEAYAIADTFSFAGYDDWRLPTIKEIYSLMDFRGITSEEEENAVPYIDTDFFEFRYGGVVNPDERIIDVQYATQTEYQGTTMNGSATMFGLNLADGRIKGYPQSKDFEVMLVRGNSSYGINDFEDNMDGTISDHATGLMWEKSGSSYGMNWEDALARADSLNAANYLGYDDWRLPNAKELQSLVDYSRSLQATDSPAIDPIFEVPEITDEGGNKNYPFYWTSTTHFDGPLPNKAVYIAFGEALGFMEQPPNSGNYVLQDVHGAGAQRSDPKDGDPADYPYGHGPQGDVIRIYNYVRCVRDFSETGINEDYDNKSGFNVYPNPANDILYIEKEFENMSKYEISIINTLGETLYRDRISEDISGGAYQINTMDLLPGIYIVKLFSENVLHTHKLIVSR